MTARETFTSQADPELLAKMRAVARIEGRHFQSVLEDAMQEYLDNKAQQNVRPGVMAHFYASLERNRRLYELLAQ